jgi:hypothetical protein
MAATVAVYFLGSFGLGFLLLFLLGLVLVFVNVAFCS